MEKDPIKVDDPYIDRNPKDIEWKKKLLGPVSFRHHMHKDETERVENTALGNSYFELEPRKKDFILRPDDPKKQNPQKMRYKHRGDMERIFDSLEHSALPQENELVEDGFRRKIGRYKRGFANYLSPQQRSEKTFLSPK